MTERDRSLEDLAAAILDGASIDWEAEESSADAVDRPLLTQLRSLAVVADFHRRPRPSIPPVATRSADNSPPEVNGHDIVDSKDPLKGAWATAERGSCPARASNPPGGSCWPLPATSRPMP